MRRLYSVEPHASVEQERNYKDIYSIDQPIYKYPPIARNTCRGKTEESECQRVQGRCDRANIWRRYSSLLLPAEKGPRDVLGPFLRLLLRAPRISAKLPSTCPDSARWTPPSYLPIWRYPCGWKGSSGSQPVPNEDEIRAPGEV